MLRERVTVNPASEDSSLVPLDFVGLDPSWGIYLMGHEYPPPELETQRASSADTEGDIVVQNRYLNRTLSVRLRLFEPDDAASTNLVTNPIAALANTNYAGVSLVSGPTRVLPANTPPGRGIDTAIEAQTNAVADYCYHPVDVVNGKTYRASVYVQLAAKVISSIRIAVYNAAGAAKKAEGPTYNVVDVTEDGWVRLDVSFVADATATWRVGVEQATAGSTTFRMTGLMVEESASLGPFFCGETPGCDWSGARHASTSTRPAPDGTRFSRIYRDVTRQLDRINQTKAGTYRRISALGKALIYDLRSARITEAPQDLGIQRRRAEIALAFEALPFGRGAEVLIAEKEEAALPVLSMLAENVPGEVDALGRLVIEEKQAQNQLAVYWGGQQQSYSASADAALFYEAESRTPLGSAATTELAGASGAGKNTIAHLALVNAYQGILSTQASGGGNQLAHVGTYRVLARVQRPATNTGEVTMLFEWAEGDFSDVTENDPVVFKADEREGVFTLEDLGLVTLSKAPTGTTQRWEGRIRAKSTVTGDDLYVDWLMFIPTEVGSGKAIAPNSPSPPAILGGFDPFSQTEGALAGKTAALGGNWAGAGDADDFTVIAAQGWAQRTAVSDAAGIGRYETLGATKYTNLAVRCVVGGPPLSTSAGMGVILRYVDTNNWLGVRVFNLLSLSSISVIKKVAGVRTQMFLGPISPSNKEAIELEVVVLSNGEWRTYVDGTFIRSGIDSSLEAAGALKEGLVGLWDEKEGAQAQTRHYDGFEAWVPTMGQVLYASRQLEIRPDLIRRQDSAGAGWGEPPYEGDFMRIPPAGPDKKITRLGIKASRNPESDAGIDDLKASLYVTPRYLMAPPT